VSAGVDRETYFGSELASSSTMVHKKHIYHRHANYQGQGLNESKLDNNQRKVLVFSVTSQNGTIIQAKISRHLRTTATSISPGPCPTSCGLNDSTSR